MRLLFTCADSANDPHLWSGTVSNCRQALLYAGVELAIYDRIPFECPLLLRLLHQAYKLPGRKTHLLQIEPTVLRRAAARIAARFAQGDCDAVFCPGTGVPVFAFLPASIPVVTYLDATKHSWIDSYFGLETLCARSRRHVDEVDRVSLFNNALTIFASDWAKSAAARDYGVPNGKMAVVPFGANLLETPDRAEVEGWIAARSRDSLRLLFLGKEWDRKGGPDALALVRALRVRGVPASLDIVGCAPVLSSEDAALARIHGFIDHSAPAGRDKFHLILREAHVLVFLSRAEAFGIALCEAAAFGVPAYATGLGGIPTIVRDGVNGWLGNPAFSPEDAAATITAVWRSPDQYQRIALAARADFEARLNWQVAGQSLKTHIEHALDARRGISGDDKPLPSGLHEPRRESSYPMKSIVVTLFEGDYHLGAAALINSLCAAGFDGTVICGHRGPPPPWAEAAGALAPQIAVRFVQLDTPIHLANYKPVFLRNCWRTHGADAGQLYYFDPDIVVKGPWSVVDRWARDGIALSEDLNSHFPAGHPYRLAWLDFFGRQQLCPVRALDRYYNSGFLGVSRAHGRLLDLWADLIALSAQETGTLSSLKNRGPHVLFHSADQDALNMALLLTDLPINGAGPEAMDFIPGGHLLSHAAGASKPWRGGFVGAALRGRPPGPAQKFFHDYAVGPLPVLPAGKLAYRRAGLRLASLIGRFYRRT